MKFRAQIPSFFCLLTLAVIAPLALAQPAANATKNSSSAPQASAPLSSATACPSLLQHQFARLQDEAPQNLCQYAGKVILVVNTASYCGFTPQYEGLEALYAKYKDKGLVVLGFPSNDFEQEKDSNAKIADFCFNTYGVKFPMFAKSVVKGANASVFFKQLAKDTDTPPRWNFYKYLIDRNGKAVKAYNSMSSPQSGSVTQAIEKLL